MSYRLQPDEPVLDGVRRVALDQIDKAVEDLDRDDRHEAVHEFRKRCKKLRALVRLVRPAFGDYRSENARFRDAARGVSDLRDATSNLETCNALAEHYGDRVDPALFDRIRASLAERRDLMIRQTGLEKRIDRCRDDLHAARGRAGSWELEESGFAAVAGGFAKTYGRAREAMREACARPTTERFHEWRKRVKYHRYHVRLLREIWRPVLDPWRDRLHELTDLLGDDHDLAVLNCTLESSGVVHASDVAALSALVLKRRSQLQAEARPLGTRLLAENKRAIVARHRIYWRATLGWSKVDRELRDAGSTLSSCRR